MSTVEQIKQEIIDWANSDDVKAVFQHAGWSESKSFPDACPYLYEYLDAVGPNEDSGVVIPSGSCQKAGEIKNGVKFEIVFSVDNGTDEKKFYRFNGRSNTYETSWERAQLVQVFIKTITTQVFVEDPS
jgi:hypothetical protein